MHVGLREEPIVIMNYMFILLNKYNLHLFNNLCVTVIIHFVAGDDLPSENEQKKVEDSLSE